MIGKNYMMIRAMAMTNVIDDWYYGGRDSGLWAGLLRLPPATCGIKFQTEADPQGSPAGSRYYWLECRTPIGCRQRDRSSAFYQNGVEI